MQCPRAVGPVADAVSSAVIQTPVTVLVTMLSTTAGKRFWDFFTDTLSRGRRRRRAQGEPGAGEDVADNGVAVVIVDSETAVRVKLTWGSLREASLPDLSVRLDAPAGERDWLGWH